MARAKKVEKSLYYRWWKKSKAISSEYTHACEVLEKKEIYICEDFGGDERLTAVFFSSAILLSEFTTITSNPMVRGSKFKILTNLSRDSFNWKGK